MKCEECQSLVLDLLYEELSGEERAQVLAHLESCPQCRREYERLRHTKALLKNLTDPELPPDLNRRIQNELKAGPTRISRLPRWLTSPRLALAAIIVLAVSILLVMNLPWSFKSLPPQKVLPPTPLLPATGSTLPQPESVLGLAKEDKETEERAKIASAEPTDLTEEKTTEEKKEAPPLQPAPSSTPVIASAATVSKTPPPTQPLPPVSEKVHPTVVQTAPPLEKASPPSPPPKEKAVATTRKTEEKPAAKPKKESEEAKEIAQAESAPTEAEKKVRESVSPSPVTTAAPSPPKAATASEEPPPKEKPGAGPPASPPPPAKASKDKEQAHTPATLISQAQEREKAKDYRSALALYQKALDQMGMPKKTTRAKTGPGSAKAEESSAGTTSESGPEPKTACTPEVKTAAEGAIRCLKKLGRFREARDLEKQLKAACE